ncbi:MAG TPA: hypothetical protein VM184_06605 [Gaiellaceae bacterium]|nr:hypothetical protein [Gaiellaceae bacterium]
MPRALLVAVLSVVLAAVSLSADVNLRTAAKLPIWGSLTHRLAGYTADQKTPALYRQVPAEAVEAAGDELRRGETYFVHTSNDSLEYTSLLSAGRLYIPHAIPVASVELADAVLSFNAPRPLPRGASAASAVRLGGGLQLIRLRR